MAECARCEATHERLFHMDSREALKKIEQIEEIIREHRHHACYVPQFIVDVLLVEEPDDG